MFKRPLVAVAIASASFAVFANEHAAPEADLIIEIRDLTEPNYALPESTVVITGTELMQRGFTNIVEVLETYSSFRSSTDSTGAKRSTAIDLRGFGETAARNVMILLDDIPLNNPTLEAPNLGLIPLSTIRKIELIPSGSGVLFGNGAVGGVIRITTKHELQELRPIYSLSAGSFGFFEASAMGTLPLDRASLSGEVTTQSADGYRHHNDSAFKSGKLTYRFSGDHDLSISHARSLDQRNAAGASLPSVIALDRRDSASDDRSHIDYRQAITSIVIGRPIRNAHARIQLTHRQSDQRGAYENPTYGAIAQNLDVYALKTELASVRTAQKKTWLAGLELGNGRYSSRFVSPKRTQTHAGIYGQQSIQLDESLAVSFGGRYQWLKDAMGNGFDAERTLSALDLSASKVLNHFTVSGRIEQNFRYATLDEQSQSGDALKPQEGRGIELRLAHQFGALSWWQLDTKQEILFDANDTSQSLFGSNINVEKTARAGVSGNINLPLSDASLLQLEITYVDAAIKAGNFKGSAIPAVSPLQAGLRYTTQWNDRIQTQLSHRWYSSAYAVTDYENDLGRHNSYTTTTVDTAYQQGNWQLSLQISNLFDVDRDAYVYNSYGTLKRTPAEPQSLMLTFRYFPE